MTAPTLDQQIAVAECAVVFAGYDEEAAKVRTRQAEAHLRGLKAKKQERRGPFGLPADGNKWTVCSWFSLHQHANGSWFVASELADQANVELALRDLHLALSRIIPGPTDEELRREFRSLGFACSACPVGAEIYSAGARRLSNGK